MSASAVAASSNGTLGWTLARCLPSGRPEPSAVAPVPPAGVVIGADRTWCGVSMAEPGVVSGHASIAAGPDGLRVRAGTGGVRVNARWIGAELPLDEGDVVRVGDLLLVVGRGEDPMVGVRRGIARVAARRHSVVVTGATGTGKEVVARELHTASGRRGEFVAVNCSTFSEALLPSELFGHVRGAFTGAVSEQLGLFRAAEGGTLLLDEIAELPLSLQAPLLRVLETREVRPVGGTRDVGIDVRVIATAPRELYALVQAGRFRADLYSRLAQWTIRLPSLAERRADIPALAACLLPRVEGEGRALTADLGEALLAHPWPLNVRGLLNVLAIAVLCTDDPTGPLMLSPEVVQALEETRDLLPPDELSADGAARPTLSRDELEELLIRFQGHVAAIGRHAGLTRSKLYRLLDTHRLDVATYRDSSPRTPRPAQERSDGAPVA